MVTWQAAVLAIVVIWDLFWIAMLLSSIEKHLYGIRKSLERPQETHVLIAPQQELKH